MVVDRLALRLAVGVVRLRQRRRHRMLYRQPDATTRDALRNHGAPYCLTNGAPPC